MIEHVASSLEVLTIQDRERWLEVLARVDRFDVYHLPQYYELAERTGEGTGRLLVYEHPEGVIALPLLLRSCGSIEGLEGETSLDAGSVYGYAGPLSGGPAPSCDVIADFQSAVRGVLGSLGVVAVFSSLHPLISQRELVEGLGTTTTTGVTVSIDLRLSTEAQLAQYRANHARGIRKLRAMGATCEVGDPQDLGKFIEIYHETMARVGASAYYFFDQQYFALLRDLLGSRLKLLTCTLDDEVIAAGLFFVCGDTMQYHLGATRNDRVGLGPMKLIIDTARAWGTEAGMAVLHLGGGVGAQEDSLFHFKAGFSGRRHPYAAWRWMADPASYRHLTARKAAANAARGVGFSCSEYFPLYRSRVGPLVGVPTGGVTTGAEAGMRAAVVTR